MSKRLFGLGYVTMWYRTLSFAIRLNVFISLLAFHTQWSMDSKFKDFIFAITDHLTFSSPL